MKIKRKSIIASLLVAILVVTMCPHYAEASSKKTATVTTQKEINAALKNPGTKKIIIDTDEKVSLKIKANAAASPNIEINAPKASVTVNNNTNKVIVNEASSVKVTGTVSNLTSYDSKLKITVGSKGEVDSIKVAADDCKLTLTNNGSLSSINITKSGDITLRGASSEKTNVMVRSGAEGTKIASEVPLKITSKANIDLELNEGAEKSSVKLSGESAGVALTNNTSGKITLTDQNGEKIKVESGNAADLGEAAVAKAKAEEAVSEAEEAARKAEEEAKKAEEEAKKKAEEDQKNQGAIYIPVDPTPHVPTPPADQVVTVTIGGIGYTATTKFNAQGCKTETRYVNNSTDKLWKVEYFNTSGVLTGEDTYEYIANDSPSLTSIDCIKVTSGASISGNLNFSIYTYNNNSTDWLSYLKAELKVEPNRSPLLESSEIMLRVTGEGSYPPYSITASTSLSLAEHYINNERYSFINGVKEVLGVSAAANRIEKIVCSCSNNQLITVDAKFCNITDGFSESNIILRILYDCTLHTNTRIEKDSSGNGGYTTTVEIHPDHNSTITTSSSITYNADGVCIKTEECDYRDPSHKTRITTEYNPNDVLSYRVITTDLTTGNIESVKDFAYISVNKLRTLTEYISTNRSLENIKVVSKESIEYDASGNMSSRSTSQYHRGEGYTDFTLTQTTTYYVDDQPSTICVGEYEFMNSNYYLVSRTTGSYDRDSQTFTYPSDGTITIDPETTAISYPHYYPVS